MELSCMEEGCCGDSCRAGRCRVQHEANHYQRPSTEWKQYNQPTDVKIRHLICLTRLQTGILLLLFTTLFVFVYIHHRQTSDQLVPSYGNNSGTSALKQQQPRPEEGNPIAFLTAPNNPELKHCADLTLGLELLKWEYVDGKVLLVAFQFEEDTDLIVPTAGYYNVYVQITYECREDEDDDDDVMYEDNFAVGITVMLRAKGYEKDVALLISSDTLDCKTAKYKKSIYTSGVFKLNATDRLKVKAKYRELISRSQYEVFFGASRLGDIGVSQYPTT